MIFKRELTPAEVKALGAEPKHRINEMLNVILHRLMNTKRPGTIESRIISVLSNEPMNARHITDAHNVIYGHRTLNYIRFIINGMHQSGLIKRASRGHYVKL